MSDKNCRLGCAIILGEIGDRLISREISERLYVNQRPQSTNVSFSKPTLDQITTNPYLLHAEPLLYEINDEDFSVKYWVQTDKKNDA